ncbi:MAG TPA: hypothetical protein VE961_06160 [Pyrinomonadaceae bacterium]|nr:hypothetical protein [Pyrinomonadaceae bacterium]
MSGIAVGEIPWAINVKTFLSDVLKPATKISFRDRETQSGTHDSIKLGERVLGPMTEKKMEAAKRVTAD